MYMRHQNIIQKLWQQGVLFKKTTPKCICKQCQKRVKHCQKQEILKILNLQMGSRQSRYGILCLKSNHYSERCR